MNSYLKFLSRNKLYTAIEAVGLVVALAFVIIIGSSIRDQIGIVYQVPDHEHLYLVGPRSSPNGAEYRMKQQIIQLPQLEKVAGFTMNQGLFEVTGERTIARILVSDPELLEMIPLKVLSGDRDLLKDPESLVVTESFARRFFPGRNPVGETISYLEDTGSSPISMRIASVIEDPSYSLIGDFDVAVNMLSQSCEAARQVRGSDLRETGMGMMVFFLGKVHPEADLAALSNQIEALPGWMNRHLDENNPIRNLTPYSEIYYSDYLFHPFRQGKKMYLTVLVALGILLLLSALLSYINLSLASSGDRAREMATRRLVGEERTGIFRRVMRETLLFTLACFLLALLLAFLLAPLMDSLRPTGLNVPFRIRPNGFFWLGSAAFVLLLSLAAGLIPAWTSASFKPLDVVTGKIRRKRKMYFNRICIIFQSALALLLLVMTLLLGYQLRYIEHADLGADPLPDLYFFGAGVMMSDTQQEAFADLLRSNPQVKEIGWTSGYPTYVRSFSSGTKQHLYTISCDTTAFAMLGFRLVEQFAQINESVVVSRSAANACGISAENTSPAALYWGYDRHRQHYPSVIGGIVEDFRMVPVNGTIDLEKNAPVIRLDNQKGWSKGLLIRTSGNRRAFAHWVRDAANSFGKEAIGMNLFDAYGFMDLHNGYIDDLIAADHDDLRRYTRLVEIFAAVAILLSMLALLAMSSYYAGANAKSIAIRKVFGGTVKGETRRGVLTFMGWIAISIVIAIPAAIWLSARFLENYPERITRYGWIFVVAALTVLLLAFVSVLWQTLKAAKTNPAKELKKE